MLHNSLHFMISDDNIYLFIFCRSLYPRAWWFFRWKLVDDLSLDFLALLSIFPNFISWYSTRLWDTTVRFINHLINLNKSFNKNIYSYTVKSLHIIVLYYLGRSKNLYKNNNNHATKNWIIMTLFKIMGMMESTIKRFFINRFHIFISSFCVIILSNLIICVIMMRKPK